MIIAYLAWDPGPFAGGPQWCLDVISWLSAPGYLVVVKLVNPSTRVPVGLGVGAQVLVNGIVWYWIARVSIGIAARFWLRRVKPEL